MSDAVSNDVSDLLSVYERFLDVAKEGRFDPPPGGEWQAEVVIAHVIANDRLLAAHIAEAMAGGSPSYDNRPATRERYLRSIIEASRDRGGLIEAARRSSREVLDLAAALSRDGSRAYPTFIIDGDTVQVDQPLTLAALLSAQVRVHLPLHTAQLEALRPPQPLTAAG